MKQIEEARYTFVWGAETVIGFIHRMDWSHAFSTDISPIRASIDQDEFEAICYEVLEQYQNVSGLRFEYGTLRFRFPSHSRKYLLDGGVFFEDNGYITGDNWKYSTSYDANLPRIIGERISNKIRSALYE